MFMWRDVGSPDPATLRGREPVTVRHRSRAARSPVDQLWPRATPLPTDEMTDPTQHLRNDRPYVVGGSLPPRHLVADNPGVVRPPSESNGT
jgi:hypothetical protein